MPFIAVINMITPHFGFSKETAFGALPTIVFNKFLETHFTLLLRLV
jgi:hypothetical protein